MWIVFKLFMIAAGFFSRVYNRHVARIGGSPASIHAGRSVYVRTSKHKGRVVSTLLYTSFPTPMTFRLTPESWYDKLGKLVGFSEEIQTGDSQFDDTVYIASDSLALRREFRGDATARHRLLQIFARDCQRITGDGQTLSASFKGDASENRGLQEEMAHLANQISELCSAPVESTEKTFERTVMFIEAVIWSLAAFAISLFVELAINDADVHLNHRALLTSGLSCGFAFAAILVFSIVFFLRGSSRSHRVIVESFFALVLSLPFAGIGAIADINTNFDDRSPVVVQSRVESMRMQKHRRRKGGTYYTYHLEVARYDAESGFHLPNEIKISSDLYSSLQVGAPIEITIGRGRLGLAWIRQIRRL